MSKSKTMRRLLALAMALAILLAFSGCGKEVDPKAAVKDAAIATFDAFGAVSGELGFDAVSELSAGKYGESLGLYLKDANVGADISAFYGSGFTLEGAADIAERTVTADIGVRLADYDLLSLGVILKDSLLGMSCPELLGDTVYALDTETMAEDFGGTEMESLAGYNIFDMMENYIGADGRFALSEETVAAFEAAYDAMAGASDWAAIDKASITSGSDTLECEAYTANVPAEAMIAFISDIVETSLNDDYISTIMELSLSSQPGLYDSYDSFVAETVAALEEQLAASITEPADLVFYVNDGLLRSIEASAAIAGVNTDLTVSFGCGKNVADRFELSVTASDDSGELAYLKLSSEGSHVPADGKYTDSTVIDINGMAEMAWDVDYDVEGGAYSLSGYIDAQGTNIDFSSEGTLTVGGEGMDMSIDDLSFSAMGFSVSLNGSYSIYPVDSVEADVSDLVYIKDLTGSDLEALEATVTENATSMVFGLLSEVPELAQLLMG